VYWNDFVIMNCYCVLTVLERSLKKLLCEKDVFMLTALC